MLASPYFSMLHFVNKQSENPADFFLDIISGTAAAPSAAVECSTSFLDETNLLPEPIVRGMRCISCLLQAISSPAIFSVLTPSRGGMLLQGVRRWRPTAALS
jgi:hypothetical protein